MQVALICLFACVLAATAFPENYIPILSKSEIHQPDGSYQLKYQTGDGQVFSETAQVVRNSDNTGDVLVKSGYNTYYSPEGVPISTSFIADENGYRVSGSHIPTPPPAPAAPF